MYASDCIKNFCPDHTERFSSTFCVGQELRIAKTGCFRMYGSSIMNI